MRVPSASTGSVGACETAGREAERVLELLLFAASAAAFAVCGWLSFRLADGAPRGERPIWLLAAGACVIGFAVRVWLAVQSLDGTESAPVGIQVTLITNPAILSVVLAFITPILRTYRVADVRRAAAEEAFRRSLDDARDAIALLDPDMRVTYANHAAVALVQRPLDEVLGRRGPDFVFRAPGRESTEVRTPVPVTQSVRLERELQRGDGSVVPIECEMVPLGDGRTLVVSRDLTPRREAEANRVRAERATASQALAASIGSDLRDALSFVQSSLELSAELGSERVPLAPAIAATEAALDVIDQFLATAPALPAALTLGVPLDVRLAVTDAVNAATMRLGERTSIEWVPPDHTVFVPATTEEITAIVGALLANADASIRESLTMHPADTAFRGRVTVRVEELPVETATLREVRIVVDDNAGSLSPEVRSHMFEPLGDSLGRVSRQLGLGATHARVLRLGGSMTVAHHASGGTSVTVRLPGA
jgi:PAS domain S-box-containing protein